MESVRILSEESAEPFVCGIVFRVGRADERVVTGGITHLVEHIALPTHWEPAVEFNGSVEPLFTHFWFAGPKNEALAMLQRLTADLVAPPLQRLPRECSILRAEASWRGAAAAYTLASHLRFGAAGHGLPFIYEYGLDWLGRADLREWVATAFCAANATAYMTSEPPDGFELKLPRGERLPPPRLEPLAEVELPAVYGQGPPGGAAISLLVKRELASRMLAAIATRRLQKLLRYQLGVVYAVGNVHEPLDTLTGHLLLSADALPENVDTVRNGLIVVLDELADIGPDERELEQERESLAHEIQHPYSLPARLFSFACGELDGSGGLHMQEILAGFSAITGDAIREKAADAMESALLVLPADATVPEGRFSVYPTSSTTKVEGQRFWRIVGEGETPPDNPEALIVGAQGVTLDRGEGCLMTVEFGSCAARLRWPEGVGLWSPDGFYVYVDPDQWQSGAEALDKVIAGDVPAGNDVDLRTWPTLFEDSDLVAGVRAHEEERWSDEIALLEGGLSRAPDEAEAWRYLAFAHGQTGPSAGRPPRRNVRPSLTRSTRGWPATRLTR